MVAKIKSFRPAGSRLTTSNGPTLRLVSLKANKSPNIDFLVVPADTNCRKSTFNKRRSAVVERLHIARVNRPPSISTQVEKEQERKPLRKISVVNTGCHTEASLCSALEKKHNKQAGGTVRRVRPSTNALQKRRNPLVEKLHKTNQSNSSTEVEIENKIKKLKTSRIVNIPPDNNDGYMNTEQSSRVEIDHKDEIDHKNEIIVGSSGDRFQALIGTTLDDEKISNLGIEANEKREAKEENDENAAKESIQNGDDCNIKRNECPDIAMFVLGKGGVTALFLGKQIDHFLHNVISCGMK